MRCIICGGTSFSIRLSVPPSIFESLQILSGDCGFIFHCERHYLVCYLVAPCLCAICLIGSKSFHFPSGIPASLISVTSKFGSPDADVPLLVTHVLSKVELTKRDSLGIDHGDGCQPFDSDIHSEDVHSSIGLLHRELFFKSDLGDPPSSGKDLEVGELVTPLNMFFESTPSSILSYGYANSTFNGSYGENGIPSICLSKTPASWNIIAKWEELEPSIYTASISPDIAFTVRDNLGLEFEPVTTVFVGEVMEFRA